MYSVKRQQARLSNRHARDLLGGRITIIYNGFEVSANARFSEDFMFAGLTTERSETLNCDGSTTGTNARDNPNGLRFCGATFRAGEVPLAVQGVGLLHAAGTRLQK